MTPDCFVFCAEPPHWHTAPPSGHGPCGLGRRPDRVLRWWKAAHFYSQLRSRSSSSKVEPRVITQTLPLRCKFKLFSPFLGPCREARWEQGEFSFLFVLWPPSQSRGRASQVLRAALGWFCSLGLLGKAVSLCPRPLFRTRAALMASSDTTLRGSLLGAPHPGASPCAFLAGVDLLLRLPTPRHPCKAPLPTLGTSLPPCSSAAAAPRMPPGKPPFPSGTELVADGIRA